MRSLGFAFGRSDDEEVVALSCDQSLERRGGATVRDFESEPGRLCGGFFEQRRPGLPFVSSTSVEGNDRHEREPSDAIAEDPLSTVDCRVRLG